MRPGARFLLKRFLIPQQVASADRFYVLKSDTSYFSIRLRLSWKRLMDRTTPLLFSLTLEQLHVRVV